MLLPPPSAPPLPSLLLLAAKPLPLHLHNIMHTFHFLQVDITDYVASNEWTLVDHPAKRNVKHYPCCDEPYIDLTFIIVVRRMGAFYSYCLILPCVLLSFLTLVVFWLPPESSAKMMIGDYIKFCFDMGTVVSNTV